MSKKIVGLLIGVILAFGTTYAMAAGGHVDSRTLGAGMTSISSCQSAPVRLSFDGDAGGALDVTVDDLDTSPSSCGGKALKVILLPSGYEEVMTVPTSGSAVTLRFADVTADSVTGARVMVAG